MDDRLKTMLQSVLINIDVLNDQVQRLSRSDQFIVSNHSFQLIEHIRTSCMCCMQNIRTIERKLTKAQKNLHEANPPPQEQS